MNWCLLTGWAVVLRCTLFAVVNARWTTSNQKLLLLEPQWIKSSKGAKRLLILSVYSLRGIRAYDELQIVVTEVGQVKQTVTDMYHVTQLLENASWSMLSFNRKCSAITAFCVFFTAWLIIFTSNNLPLKPFSLHFYLLEISNWKSTSPPSNSFFMKYKWV